MKPHRDSGSTRRRRDTPQRQVVLEELQKTSSHPTAGELYVAVRRRMPKISLGTVYRNLDLLARMGRIQKLDLGGSEARFDARLDRHNHVRCVRCGRVDDLEGLPADLGGDCTSVMGGWEILGYRLQFDGVCPACRGQPDTIGRAPARSRKAC